MAARQIPPAGERVTASAIERAFERKVRLSKWALLFEQLWPRAWLLLGLAGLFIGRLAGRACGRGCRSCRTRSCSACSASPSLAALVALARVRWPSREEAIRRVEGVSGIKHRPASSYEDTLTLGAEDARTAALWRVHRQRLAALLAKLRVGRPAPRTDRYDPFALRALLLLGVFVLLVVVGDSASDRLRSAFRFGAARQGRGSAPRCLGDAAGLHRQAAHHAGRRRRTAWPGRRRQAGRPYEVPDQQPAGRPRAAAPPSAPCRWRCGGSDGATERIEAPAAGQRHGRGRAQARGAQVGHGDGPRSAARSWRAGRSR